MTVLSLLAASFTFTATATGVEKGAPIEFPFVGDGSDRTYESLFTIDGSVDDFCRGIEAAGCPRGKPEDVRRCILWPVGCRITLKPSLDEYLESKLSDGSEPVPVIYTGGLRRPDGRCDAGTNMPLCVFCTYSLSQSPLVFGTHYEQGNVYNSHLARRRLEKGTRVQFTLSWDDTSMPKPLHLVVRPGSATEVIRSLKAASEKGEVDALVDFDESLTAGEAHRAANALSVIDSHRVKINGVRPGHLYFRAFLPMVKWLDRQERLVQPFELTIGPTNRLVHVNEDWSVEGPDPALSPHEIQLSDVVRYPNTDTCFVYCKPTVCLREIYAFVSNPHLCRIKTWYVFVRD